MYGLYSGLSLVVINRLVINVAKSKTNHIAKIYPSVALNAHIFPRILALILFESVLVIHWI